MSDHWHAFTGTSDDGIFGLSVFGPTPRSADDRTESGELVRDYTIPMDWGIVATYAATFDHEPTDAEKDALNPDPDPGTGGGVTAAGIAGRIVAAHQLADSSRDGVLGCTECGWRGATLDDFGAHVVAELAAARVACVQLPTPDATGNYLTGFGRTRVWINGRPGAPGRVADGTSPARFTTYDVEHLEAYVGALLAAKVDLEAGVAATMWPT